MRQIIKYAPVVAAGWFFLATKTLLGVTLPPVQVGPFASAKACCAGYNAFTSGYVNGVEESTGITWTGSKCYSSQGNVVDTISCCAPVSAPTK